MNSQNETVCISANELKEAISNGNLTCVNLQLTKDGRLINKIEKAKYYRYTIYKNNNYIGGLFRGIDKVLHNINAFAGDGNELAIMDYEDVNRMIGEIEYNLKFPEITGNNIVFYFKENMRNEILESLNSIRNIINDYEYILRESSITNINKAKVVYEDDDQIAIIQ